MLVAFVHYDGVDAFDRPTQAQLRDVARRTLQLGKTPGVLFAGMRMTVVLDDSAAMAAVESLTDEAEIRARGVTDPWVIDWIAEAAKDAVNGQMQRVPLLCCGLPLTHYRRSGQ